MNDLDYQDHIEPIWCKIEKIDSAIESVESEAERNKQAILSLISFLRMGQIIKRDPGALRMLDTIENELK